MAADISKARAIKVIIGDIFYNVRYLNSDGRTLHFEIISGNCREFSCIGMNSKLSFVYEKMLFSGSGYSYCTVTNRLVFVMSDPFTPDKRTDLRFDMPLMPAKIKEYGLFHIKHETKALILNLSRRGTSFETETHLPDKKKYYLEISLGLLNSPDLVISINRNEKYVTLVEIVDKRKKEDVFIYHSRFKETSPEYQRILGKFVRNLEKEVFSSPA